MVSELYAHNDCDSGHKYSIIKMCKVGRTAGSILWTETLNQMQDVILQWKKDEQSQVDYEKQTESRDSPVNGGYKPAAFAHAEGFVVTEAK